MDEMPMRAALAEVKEGVQTLGRQRDKAESERDDLAARIARVEALADELDRRKDEQRGIAALNSNESLAAHHYGAAKGYERSARLIREHLATPTGRTTQ